MFRLISIKITECCQPSIQKNLKLGEKYSFIHLNGKESDFFDISSKKNKVSVSVHAVVGKNGSGKSTIFEIIFRMINMLALKYIHPDNITAVYGFAAELKYQIDKTDFILTVNTMNRDKIICQVLKNGDNILSNTNSQFKEELFYNFFYTIAANYSPYAYNANDFVSENENNKNWIEGIFHKNDGYKTPIVLLPFREKGNININNEAYLAISRFLTLLVYNTQYVNDSFFNSINEHNEVCGLKLTQSDNKQKFASEEYIESIKKGWIEVLKKQSCYKIVRDLLNSNNKSSFQKAIDYLFYKTEAIYDAYYTDCQSNIGIDWKEVITKIYNDKSHITVKIFQTLEYIENTHKLYDRGNLLKINDFSRYFKTLHKDSQYVKELIYYMPPPFIKVDILLSSDKSNIYSFSQLSSGEKQQIFALSYILYHLRNIDSIKCNSNRFAYRYVNIMVDEIELCYHPEMQRRQVYDLLYILQTYPFRQIKGINLIFSTHSPFILSDIPIENVLLLNDKSNIEESAQTFAANIGELFYTHFFMQETIGKFAAEKIKDILKLSKDYKECEEQIKSYKSFFETVGDPILKRLLIQHLDEGK